MIPYLHSPFGSGYPAPSTVPPAQPGYGGAFAMGGSAPGGWNPQLMAGKTDSGWAGMDSFPSPSGVAPAQPGMAPTAAGTGSGIFHNGIEIPDYGAIKAASTLIPGQGWIQNDRLQSDSRGSWIGAPSANSTTGPDGWQSNWGGGGAAGGGAAGGSGADWTPSPQNFQANYGTPAGNPYQDGMDAAITSQATKWLTETALPGIQSNFVGTGGLGGARQGVAQSGAIGQAHQNLTNALTQARYGQFNQDQNRNLQRYQGDQGFYTQNRGLDMDRQRIGLAGYNLGQQSDWTGLQNANGIFGPWGSRGSTTTNNTISGGGWPGALGGILGGASFASRMGLFGNGNSTGSGGSDWSWTGSDWAF